MRIVVAGCSAHCPPEEVQVLVKGDICQHPSGRLDLWAVGGILHLLASNPYQQLQQWVPLARIVENPQVIREEEGHIDFGTNKAAEFAAKGGEAKERIQGAVDRWYAKGLDMFGRSESKRSERYMYWGLKRRTNGEARRQYTEEVNGLLKQMGLQIPDPNKGRLYT